MQSITVCMMPTDLLALDMLTAMYGNVADGVLACAYVI